ncbi:hypothetical protein [Flavobacterium terrigena]|uniref:Bacteriocin-type signal sequence-containing protein n=1 Tax=Flavobacterium terrigena TaxID=402734 RepID=A0A1H6UX84_9FLAO|nr:hypothetical protein [Flavobacterium terrigena]SEI92940.1 bacteriocin-type signal sequence-containing protein [Flavobacterium terrigena]
MENFKNLKGTKILTVNELKSINGGRVWTVTCNDGTQYCPNPNGTTQQQLVDMCYGHGGFKRQSLED